VSFRDWLLFPSYVRLSALNHWLPEWRAFLNLSVSYSLIATSLVIHSFQSPDARSASPFLNISLLFTLRCYFDLILSISSPPSFTPPLPSSLSLFSPFLHQFSSSNTHPSQPHPLPLISTPLISAPRASTLPPAKRYLLPLAMISINWRLRQLVPKCEYDQVERN
jgi:hypothetical protein